MTGRFVAAVALLAFGAGCSEPKSATYESHPVVVAIVVDQLAAWVASERLPRLPDSGGFARLRREGTWVTAMTYEHAVTDTAPGHSALFTGAVPHDSGIFANEVLGEDGHPVSILRDPSTRLVTADGEVDGASSSLAALAVPTLADEIRTELPDAFIAALSLKDRGALFAAGRRPDGALWLDVGKNAFVTSTAYAHALPRWASSAREELARAEGGTWTLLDAPWVRAHAATPDAEAGEGDEGGLGTVFPHVLAGTKKPARAFRTTPLSDDVLLDLTLAALDQARTTPRPTFVSVSLSANDYIGHTFGPDSWEAWDELLRLDAALGGFMGELDKRFGRDGWAVLLTGDHGTTPMPETGRHGYCDAEDPWQRACGPTHRVMANELAAAFETKARAALGPPPSNDGGWVRGVSDPYVYLSAAAKALDPARGALLQTALREAAGSYPGVLGITFARDVPPVCPGWDDESLEALVCRSIPPNAGDAYVLLQRGSFFDPNVVVGKGTSHGSPYRFDRTVPLLVRAPGRVPSGVVVPKEYFTSFVRTAAALLGVRPPANAGMGRALTSAP